MKITFLVTFYNQEKYVSNCLDSILKINKDCDWSILIGDDCSSDRTREIVKEYTNKYPDNIFLFVTDKKKSDKRSSTKYASLNRLNLLKHVSGEYFCIIDGDDFYTDKDFVNNAIDLMESDSNISIVAHKFKYYLEDLEQTKTEVKFKKTGLISKRFYLENQYVPAGACVFRNKFTAERIRILNKIGFYDDNDIVIENLNYGDIYLKDTFVYNYRQIKSSICNSSHKLELAAYNLVGYVTDDILTNHKYTKSLLKRNSYALIYLYICKKNKIKISNEYKIKEICDFLKNNKSAYIWLFADEQKYYSRSVVNEYIEIVIKNIKNVIKAIINIYIVKDYEN